MTASQPSFGTTSSPSPGSSAPVLVTVAILLACLVLGAPAAHAADSGEVLGAAVLPAPQPATPSVAVTAERTARAAANRMARAAARHTAHAPTHRTSHAPTRRSAHAALARRTAHAAARGCAPAHGSLRSRRSVLSTQRRLLCLMNRARAHFGLRPLRTNRCLHRVAARHAHDMVYRRYFAHTTPNGWDPGQRARASGYVPRAAAWIVGENIAWGVAEAARPAWVMRAWMHSPPHRHNILDRHFRDVGIGVARGIPLAGFGGIRLRATFSVEFGAHRGRTRCG